MSVPTWPSTHAVVAASPPREQARLQFCWNNPLDSPRWIWLIPAVPRTYRAVDFRKPLGRIKGEQQRINGQIRDFPVFNGKYSTTCYIDATVQATLDMLQHKPAPGVALDTGLHAVFMHRPYRKMPEAGFAHAWLLSMALAEGEDQSIFIELAEAAGVSHQELHQELTSSKRLMDLVEQRRLSDEAFPLTRQTLLGFRKEPAYRSRVLGKTGAGC